MCIIRPQSPAVALEPRSSQYLEQVQAPTLNASADCPQSHTINYQRPAQVADLTAAERNDEADRPPTAL